MASNILHPEVLAVDEADIVDDEDEDELGPLAPSFDTVVSCLDTALKFLRTLPYSEKVLVRSRTSKLLGRPSVESITAVLNNQIHPVC